MEDLISNQLLKPILFSIPLFFVGIFALVMTIKKPNFYWESRKAKQMRSLIGDKATHMLYLCIAIFTIVASIALPILTSTGILNYYSASDADELYLNGNYEEAIVAYTEILEDRPEDEELLHGLALSYDSSADYENALKYYDLSIKYSENPTTIYINRGNTYIGLGRYAEAISDYDVAINVAEDKRYAYYGRALAHYENYNFEEAIQSFNDYKQLEPEDADVYMYIGECNYSLGNYKEAIEYYKSTLEIDDSYYMLHSYIADSYYNLSMFNESLSSYNQALELDPENLSILFSKSRVLSTLERDDEAFIIFSSLIENDEYYRDEILLDDAFSRYHENQKFLDIIGKESTDVNS